MDSFVYDSPLSDYLEGRGEAPTLDAQLGSDNTPCPDPEPSFTSFAPSAASTAYKKYRKRIPTALKIDARSTSQSISRLRSACARAVRGQLGESENAAFLERFRYAIIASDLLSEHHQGYSKSSEALGPSDAHLDQTAKPVFSNNGVYGISGAAFTLAASIAWARRVSGPSGVLHMALLLVLLAIGTTAFYAFTRRKLLQHVRVQSADNVATFVANAKAFDTTLLAAVTIVQEVELVARGYRVSTPLPPVSRMDDPGQHRRCARLRTTAKTAIAELLHPLASAAVALEKQTKRADLERYHDIYEVTRTDIEGVTQLSYGSPGSDEDAESLKSLKLGVQKLFLARKLLLCDLLALDADGTTADSPRWALVTETLQKLSITYGQSATALDALLSDEERFAAPPTPKMPLTPSRERARTQIRKLGGLSSGIRGLQAKMHLLREEADRHLDNAEDAGSLGNILMSQYEAIGVDLKALLQEWEEGKAALSQSHNKRQSLSSAGLLSPRSETPTSWSGTTATSGSPADALKALNGDLSPRMDATSSDEEVFEAIAIPRQRSTLTREERIARMREDRDVREKAKESRQASTNMLRELETVLKYKPQGSKSTRRVTVM